MSKEELFLEEQKIRDFIYLLYEDYKKQIRPWVDKLVELENLQQKCTVFLPNADAPNPKDT